MRKLKLPGRDKTRPRLEEHDIAMVRKLGISGIKEQARDIVELKLKEQPENDGHQTPVRGNPVYKAMHACNASDRKILSLAHRMPAGRPLTDSQIDSIVNMLVRWVAREYNFYFEEQEMQQKNLREY